MTEEPDNRPRDSGSDPLEALSASDYPRAVLERPAGSLGWLLLPAGLAAVIVATLLLPYLTTGDTLVVVSFQEGHGIRAGNALKYRGIVVGEVKSVRLSRHFDGVDVNLALAPEAADLARAGSRFWIVRPLLSLRRVQGLDTIIGARYLTVLPGPRDAPRRTKFTGLEAPPVIQDQGRIGLELLLEADGKKGMDRGSPVLYRGIVVGRILSVSLSSDGASVVARAAMEPKYQPLIRENSRFWISGSMEIEGDFFWGLASGALDLGALQAITGGGVEMATPDRPGPPVAQGHRFRIANQPEEGWREWRPRIAIGSPLLPARSRRPKPLGLQVLWKKPGLLYGERKVSRTGWGLMVEGIGLLTPKDLFPSFAREKVIGGKATLLVAGKKLQITPKKITRHGFLAILPMKTEELPGNTEAMIWPMKRVRGADDPENCALFANPGNEAIPLDDGSIQKDGKSWLLDSRIRLGNRWHGAAALSRKDGRLIGIVVITQEEARIQTLGDLQPLEAPEP